MDLNKFITQYTGQKIGPTAADNGQCTGLVMTWVANLGNPFFYGNAADLLNNADSNLYDKINNSPTGVPTPGDIMVWGEYAPLGISAYGHTSVFVSGDANSFTSFDQNWPTGSPCKLVKHANYGGVKGWLHPHNLPTGGDDMIDSVQKLDNLTLAVFEAHETSADEAKYMNREYDAVLTDMRNDSRYQTIQDKAGGYDVLNTRVTDLEGQLAIQTNGNKTLSDALTKSEGDLKASQSQVTTLSGQVTELTAQLKDCQNKPTPTPVPSKLPAWLQALIKAIWG